MIRRYTILATIAYLDERPYGRKAPKHWELNGYSTVVNNNRPMAVGPNNGPGKGERLRPIQYPIAKTGLGVIM
jgi:hypothetical protein